MIELTEAQEAVLMARQRDFEDMEIPAPHEAQKTAHKPVSFELKFHVSGPVVGKGRARVSNQRGFARLYTPENTVRYESLVKMAAWEAMAKDGPMSDVTQNFVLLDGPLQVNLLIGVQIPASWSKKKKMAALTGQLFPTSKPDLDNSIKSVFDAMNGVVYKDDAQVVTTVTKKRYREAPGLWVSVMQIGGEE